MDHDELTAYCLAKPGAWMDEPWEGHPVAKVDEKIFVFLGQDSVGVKAGNDRDQADEWLVRFPDDAQVMAYIGRSGWNDLAMGGTISGETILDAIDESYHLVVSKLPKKKRPDGWDAVTTSSN
ncbi:MAG: hypothetical protein HKN07_12745 [Acidimicrobiia bacterium]|nr:hypothetical protein [Acidimicrobiia bacterium]